MALGKVGIMGVLAVVLVLPLTGCSSQRKAERESRNEAEAAAIQAELAKVPGVVEVEVNYSNYITAPGSGSANLVVEPGSDMERIADLAIKAIWRSHLKPLKSIRVGLVDDKDRTLGIIRGDNVLDKRAEFEGKYGPRPVEED